MTGFLRRGSAIGLCALILGAHSPIVAVADSLSLNVSSPSHHSAAYSESNGNVPSDFSLTISPTRLAIGQADVATVQKIQAINQGQSAVAVTVQKRNFTTGFDGSLGFQQDAPYAAADWVTVSPTSFEIAPGAIQVVTATVTMPTNPEAGDYQVALVFLAPAGEGSGNIKINRGIGIPVYITAPGPIDDSVSLRDFSAPGFATGGPVTITASMQNTGTVHRDFRGNSPLTVDAPGTTAAFRDFTVTRGATRDISTTWDPPLLGIFNPTVTFTNADGRVQTASVRVIVFPVVPAIICAGALLLLFFGFWFSRRRYRASVRKAALTLNSATGGGDA